MNVCVGLRTDSASCDKAREAGLKVDTVAEAVKWADIVMILLPDQTQKSVYHGEFEDYLILEDYENYKKDNPDKPHLKNLRLTMKSDDIDYIIVRNKEDILPLISFLENQEDMGSTKKIKLLTTRIITKSQIEMDF